MKKLRLALCGALFAFSSVQLFAAPLSWDPTQSTGTALGGSGNWDQTSANWFDGTADSIWNNANNDDAIFSGTFGTVTLTENISAGNLYFTNASGNYLITNATGGEVLGVAGVIDTGGGDHTVGVPIISGTLNKNGAGRLHLPADSGATLAGPVLINQGDVSVENNNGAGQYTSITVADGAALVLNGGTAGLSAFYPTVTINGSGITNSGALRNLSGATTVNGQIILGANNSVIYADNGSSLTYNGANALTDNGNNYSLVIRASGNGNFHMGKTSIGGSLIIQGPATCYNQSLVSPTTWKSTYVSKGATLYVDAPNSFGTQPGSLMTTNVILDGGTINSGATTYNNSANTGITVTTNGGTLTVASGGIWTSGNIYSPSNASVTIGGTGASRPGGAAGTNFGTINLGTGSLIKTGSGDCHLGYANPANEIYSNLVVNAGSITLNYDVGGGVSSLGAVPNTLNASNIILNGGTLHFGHTTAIGATRGIYVTGTASSIADVTGGGTVTVLSPISGPGNMTFPLGKSGGTTAAVLAGTNTYTGTTTIAGSVTVTVGTNGPTGTLGTGNTANSGTLVFNRTGSYSYGGVISGSGPLIKNASGTVTLTGANTYTGNTTNGAGTLLINNTSKSGTGTGAVYINSGTLGGNGFISGAVTINAGAKLAPGPTVPSVGTLTISSSLTIAGNVSIAINKSLSSSNSAVVVTGALSNTGSGTLSVTNLGTALAVGDTFQIFSQPLTGNTMAVSGGGSGVTWNNNLAADGSISVATVPTPPNPAIASFSFSAGNLVLTGTNGAPSAGFSVLTSTNVTAPLASWTTVTTGSYNSSGNFAVTNTITNNGPAQFFIIKSN